MLTVTGAVWEVVVASRSSRGGWRLLFLVLGGEGDDEVDGWMAGWAARRGWLAGRPRQVGVATCTARGRWPAGFQLGPNDLHQTVLALFGLFVIGSIVNFD